MKDEIILGKDETKTLQKYFRQEKDIGYGSQKTHMEKSKEG